MPQTIKIRVPLPSTILVFFVLLTTTAFPGMQKIRGLLFIALGAYLVLIAIIGTKPIRWIHLLWTVSFYLLSFFSIRWSISPTGAEDVIDNIAYAMLLSWCFGEYIYQANRGINHICAVMAAVAVLMGINFVLNSTAVEGRYTLDINANVMGMSAAFIFGILLYGAKDARWQKWYLNALTVVTALIAVLTGSRKALLMLLLFVLAFVFFWKPEKNMAKFLVKVTVTLAVGAVVIILLLKVDVLYDIMGSRLESLYLQWFADGEADASAFSRGRMVAIGMNIFAKRPWIGFGHNAFKMGSGYDTYSHNNYVELLCSMGVVGFAVYYLPLIYYTVQAVRLWRQGIPGSILPLSIMIIQYVNDFGQVSYYSYQSCIFLGIAIGYIYLLKREYHQGKYDDVILRKRVTKRRKFIIR